MLRLSLSIVLLALLSVTTPDEVFAVELQNERPKIGLALSGGGARGAAHVGVFKVLEDLQIPVDYIAGTSMGAVVGGLYASGMSSDEIAEQLEQIDWANVFNDKPARPDRSQRRKSDDRLYLVKGKIGVTDEGLNLPKAVVQGQKFNHILKALTLPVTTISNFDMLPIPYRAVAMDITTGKQVILKSGDLATAMHASMAIPAIFAPVELDGKLLVDGGAANNLPVSVVREMGADIVIAIDISTPLLTQDELSGALAVLDQLTGLLTRRNVDIQIASLTKDDVLIIPALDDIATMDFHLVKQAVTSGKIATKAKENQLKSLSIKSTHYKHYLASHKTRDFRHPDISFLRFNNNSELSEEVLREHFKVRVGQVLNLDDIEAGIATIYGLDIFESVRYDLIREGDQSGIVVTVREKSWGTDSLQAGLELSSDFSGESSFNIGIAYTQQPINSLNGEWRTALQLGEEPAIITEIYQPLDPAARYFTHAALSWLNNDIRIFGDVSGRAEAKYEVERWGLQLAIGRNIGNWGEVRFGLRRFVGEADLATGAASFRSFDFDDGHFFVRALFDTVDNLNFPRFGYLNSFEWTSGKEALGADNDYEQFNLLLSGAKSWDDNSFIVGIRYGRTVNGDTAITNSIQYRYNNHR